MNQKIRILEERISAEEYIDFLKRTDLGSQYPKERFRERIEKLVKTVSISLVAQDECGTIVGALFGLTDFAYWLYVTDLGVDRAYTGQGIGRQLMSTAHRIAGGEKDIAVYLIANEILAIVFMIWDDFFISIYTTSSAVAAYGLIRMHHACALEGIAATYEVESSALRGMGKSLEPSIITILGTVVFRLIWMVTVFRWIPTYDMLMKKVSKYGIH